MSKECCSHPNTEPANHHNHDHSDGHTHDSADQSIFQMFLPAGISFILLMTGIFLDYYVKPEWFSGWFRFILYLVAYIPVGVPVLKLWKASVLVIFSRSFFSCLLQLLVLSELENFRKV